MVKIKEVKEDLSQASGLFWGVAMQGGKRYSQKVVTPFHISMAALEPGSAGDEDVGNGYVTVWLGIKGFDYLICTLKHDSVYNVALDYELDVGEQLDLFIMGKGTVYLTGYLRVEEPDIMDDWSDNDQDGSQQSLDSDDEDVEMERSLDSDGYNDDDDEEIIPVQTKRKAKKSKIPEEPPKRAKKDETSPAAVEKKKKAAKEAPKEPKAKVEVVEAAGQPDAATTSAKKKKAKKKKAKNNATTIEPSGRTEEATVAVGATPVSAPTNSAEEIGTAIAGDTPAAPTTDVAIDAPATEVAANAPADAPATEVAADAPATKIAADAPATKIDADSPATEVAADTPATEVTADAPATDAATHAPATKVAADAPASEAAPVSESAPASTTAEDVAAMESTSDVAKSAEKSANGEPTSADGKEADGKDAVTVTEAASVQDAALEPQQKPLEQQESMDVDSAVGPAVDAGLKMIRKEVEEVKEAASSTAPMEDASMADATAVAPTIEEASTVAVSESTEGGKSAGRTEPCDASTDGPSGDPPAKDSSAANLDVSTTADASVSEVSATPSSKKKKKKKKNKNKNESLNQSAADDEDAGNDGGEEAPTPKDVNGHVGEGKKKKGEDKKAVQSKPDEKTVESTPDKKKKAGEKTTTTPTKLPGGLVVHEQAEGSGNLAKKGAICMVRYTGRLKSNNKVFDSNVGPHLSPLKLVVGKKDVIDGFDEGVEGMKVGGKRRIVIPPHKAYGNKSPSKDIPPNSALIFDVELVKVVNKKGKNN